MSWADAGEVVKAVAPVFTAGAACFGAYIGFRGLEKWRAETIGKRKAELAEEVLADFYEAREIIQTARLGMSFGQEGNTRQRGQGETESDTRTLNSYYAVAERLSKKADFFAQLESRRYRFMAHFGLEAAQPYTILRELHGNILVSVRMLLMTHQERNLGTNPESIRQWRNSIWEMSENGETRQRLNAMIEAIEKVCRPAIQEAAK
jgi:hypothetical protein